MEFVPTELRITGDQGFEVTFRGTLEKSENAFSDACLLSHEGPFGRQVSACLSGRSGEVSCILQEVAQNNMGGVEGRTRREKIRKNGWGISAHNLFYFFIPRLNLCHEACSKRWSSD